MNIRRETLEGDVQHLIFDRPDSGANIFDRATMEELDRHLDDIEKEAKVSGLVISSAKKSIFVAGADIKELLAADLSDEDLRAVGEKGQQVFNRIEALPFPTVAAIHGAAMGGGCEVALACSYRIASDDRSTRIGLPETQLGILPAWGGSARLPRLIGLRNALDIILAGKRLAPQKARKVGMVDMVVPHEHLLRMALVCIGRGKPTRKSHKIENHPASAKLIAKIAAKDVAAKTRGLYPAVPKALEVVSTGVTMSPEAAMRLEIDALLTLARTDVCRNLVRVFFLQDRAKRYAIGLPEGVEADRRPIESVVVVGAGTMGAGIAQWASARGQQVILRDIDNKALNRGMAAIGKEYAGAVKRRIFKKSEAQRGLDRIFPSATPIPMQRVDLAIEAATENMDLKKKIFTDLAERLPEDALLATNTSGLSITELSEVVSNPERVVGIHYFNPVSRMQLVEVVAGQNTSPVALDRAVRYVQSIAKLPVVVKDSPGFVVNRILLPYLVEAGQLFAGGASMLDLDNAMLDFGMPMGPLRLIDEVGMDVSDHVARHLSASFGDRMPVPETLAKAVEKGWLGRKSGKGFYLYSKKKKKGDPPQHEAIKSLVQSQAYANTPRETLRERMVLLMLNEAARCLEENLVEAPEDVDFAMIFGTGFAPFRGGPLRYADTLGVSNVVDRMKALAEKEPRFTPCNLLVEMAAKNRSFYSEPTEKTS